MSSAVLKEAIMIAVVLLSKYKMSTAINIAGRLAALSTCAERYACPRIRTHFLEVAAAASASSHHQSSTLRLSSASEGCPLRLSNGKTKIHLDRPSERESPLHF
jgi:hypothetical protein